MRKISMDLIALEVVHHNLANVEYLPACKSVITVVVVVKFNITRHQDLVMRIGPGMATNGRCHPLTIGEYGVAVSTGANHIIFST